MSEFQFNPEERNFPIYGAAERSYPVKEPIDYRLWVVELIYVYLIGKEMILNEYVDQKVFRTAYRQWESQLSVYRFHRKVFPRMFRGRGVAPGGRIEVQGIHREVPSLHMGCRYRGCMTA